MDAESRLRDLGLVLPRAVQLPPGVELPFSWVRVHGRRVLVSGHGPLAEDGTPAEPGYDQTTAVLNGFSEVVLDVFGPDVGDHARTAIGVAALPLNLPVVVAAELELS
ncbi:hypothetical protein [Rhodococcus opacus]|uniref:RidA family protein n=1 Tax=Rhodococcus opacus TaxID=37919 RepID=A0A2S8JEF6_RHOOP|nr:hypothetical protein [Rhodococcus opacus]PQP25363.1 hypothetical protein C5613_09250 [Rhodococcus opacus]